MGRRDFGDAARDARDDARAELVLEGNAGAGMNDSRVEAWDESYGRGENFVFVPGDEAVRFVSRYLRRRVGLDRVIDVHPGAAGARSSTSAAASAGTWCSAPASVSR